MQEKVEKSPLPKKRALICSLKLLNYSRVEKCLMVRTI